LPKPLIFFSYSRHDGADFAVRLSHDLIKHGANTWIDKENIPVGSEWVVEIEDAVTNAEYVLYVVTEDANKSPNVRNEIIYAIEENKKLIPLKINECKTPLFIRTYQYIDFSKDYEAGLERLLLTLNINTGITEEKNNGGLQEISRPQASLAINKKDDSIFGKRYDSQNAAIYNAFTDPFWWIFLLLASGLSITCTFLGSSLFNYLFDEFNDIPLQYPFSWKLIIATGICWGLAYALKGKKNAPRRKYLFLGVTMPFFNIFLPEKYIDIVKGLFSGLFISTLYTMLFSMGIAFLLKKSFDNDYAPTFLICFITINIISLYTFLIEDFK
jgi:hypothetical protein